MTIGRQRVNATNFCYQHHSVEKFLDDAVELGLTQLELWGIAQHLDVAACRPYDVTLLDRRLRQRGLELYCLTPEQVMYPINIASSDAALRRSSLEFFFRAAEICRDLGGTHLFLTPGRGREDEPYEEAWKRSLEAIAVIGDFARKCGLKCLLEPLQRFESNLINSAEQLRVAIDELGDEAPGAVLDTVAMAAAGDTVDGYFDQLGDSVAHVHLVDGSPTGHLAWGDGDLPLDSYVAALDRRGYKGRFTFELFGDGHYTLHPRMAHEQSLHAFEHATERL